MATTGQPTPCLGVPESEQAALAEIEVPAEFLPTLLKEASLMVIGPASDFGVVGFRPGQSLEPELDAALAGLREADATNPDGVLLAIEDLQDVTSSASAWRPRSATRGVRGARTASPPGLRSELSGEVA